MTISNNYSAIARGVPAFVTISGEEDAITLSTHWNSGTIMVSTNEHLTDVRMSVEETRNLERLLGFLVHVATRNAAEDGL